MKRRHKDRFVLSALAFTLAALVGRPLEAKPSKARDVIEVDILEYTQGSKKPTRERTMTVPVSGAVAGWADLFDQAGLCQLRATPLPDEVTRLELDCSTRPGDKLTLELSVERAFVRDEPTLVGVVSTHGDLRIEVVATRR